MLFDIDSTLLDTYGNTVNINSRINRLCFIIAYRQICFATSVGCDAIAETKESSSRA